MEQPTHVRLSQTEPPPPEPKDLIDLKVVIGWVKLLLWFIRKRKWIPIMMVIVMGAGAIGALKVLPKTYECTSRLLAISINTRSNHRASISFALDAILRASAPVSVSRCISREWIGQQACQDPLTAPERGDHASTFTCRRSREL